MNFLELVQNTRLACGIQGTGPTSVSDVQGIEAVLVRFVKDAYIDIQNLREDWKWLEGSQSFSTVANKDTYTLTDMFISTPNFKKYQLDSFVITDSSVNKTYLQYADRNALEAQYMNTTVTGVPSTFTVDPSTNSIILKPIPNGAYMISFRYQKGPEVLTQEIQVPSMPLPFHNLIMYKAVEKMSVYLGSPELFRAYQIEALKAQNQLMRRELPKMRRMGGRPIV